MLDHFKAALNPTRRARMRRLHWKLRQTTAGVRYPRSLRGIAHTLGAGKLPEYYPLYERHLADRRWRIRHLLEIGIGGYDCPLGGGGCLRMWETFLPLARITGVDIYDKSAHDAGRVRTFRGSQGDPEFLRRVVSERGRPDIIIDDGSHQCDHIITSFNTLFPLLADDGLYVIEDTLTSYDPEYGGSRSELNNPATTIGFIKGLLDGLHHEDLGRQCGLFDRQIVGVQCYHNIVFIEKGVNGSLNAR